MERHPVVLPRAQMPNSQRGEGRGAGAGSGAVDLPKQQVISKAKPDSISTEKRENAAPAVIPRPRKGKVRFMDMEPESGPLLYNARDSMYMRAELQREFDFGIPAQEEAHRYARWCEEEARREAAEAAEAEEHGGSASPGYKKTDMVVHPKRLSTDLSAMDIDLSNLGEDVSGLDVFSRVEATLSKQQQEKRKAKEKEKKSKKESGHISSREKIKGALLSSPKRENSFNSISSVEDTLLKERKGSRFLRKVISDRVIKPREGGTPPVNDPARAQEVTGFLGKLATSSSSSQSGGRGGLPSKGVSSAPTAASGRTPSQPPSSTTATASQKESPLHHPKPRPIHTLKPPPIVDSAVSPIVQNVPPPPRPAAPPSPPRSGNNKQVQSKPQPPKSKPPPSQSHSNAVGVNGGSDKLSSTNASPNALWDANRQITPTPSPYEEASRRPSLPTQNNPRTVLAPHSHSLSLHHPREQTPSSDGRSTSPSRHPTQPPPPPYEPNPPQSVPAVKNGAGIKTQSGDDFFSRIEQEVARDWEQKAEKGVPDGGRRDKGKRMLGKALGHMGKSGEKIKEKLDKR